MSVKYEDIDYYIYIDIDNIVIERRHIFVFIKALNMKLLYFMLFSGFISVIGKEIFNNLIFE